MKSDRIESPVVLSIRADADDEHNGVSTFASTVPCHSAIFLSHPQPGHMATRLDFSRCNLEILRSELDKKPMLQS
jgi:hypothetical protein